MSGIRQATHAGSWYTSNGQELAAELQENLDKVHPLPQLGFKPPVQSAKAIIAPHAGYSYSGPAAAWAYAAIPTTKVKRVILLGPSHHVYLRGIALSPFGSYSTPIGDIPLDLEAIKELRESNAFTEFSRDNDEAEHSLEMHLPYLRHVFKGRDDLKLVPLVVGSPSPGTLQAAIEALRGYWKDDETFFVVSSDFCHWGTRFSCTPYYPKAPSIPKNPVPPVASHAISTSISAGKTNHDEPLELKKRFNISMAESPIWQSIQYMDHEGIDILRNPSSEGCLEDWENYLSRTGNTICGRNPITFLLHLIQDAGTDPSGPQPTFTFVRYEQSSQCVKGSDSSVSYVSGVLSLS